MWPPIQAPRLVGTTTAPSPTRSLKGTLMHPFAIPYFIARHGVVELSQAARVSSRLLGGTIPSVPVQAPPGAAQVLKVVGWVGWGVFVAAIAGVFAICIRMAVSAHRNRMGDGGGEEAGKLFFPLLAVIIAGAVGALLGAVT